MIFPGFPGVLSFFQVFQVEWESCTMTKFNSYQCLKKYVGEEDQAMLATKRLAGESIMRTTTLVLQTHDRYYLEKGQMSSNLKKVTCGYVRVEVCVWVCMQYLVLYCPCPLPVEGGGDTWISFDPVRTVAVHL